MTLITRRYVAPTSVRRHVPAGNLTPLAPQYSKPCPPPNILNLPTPMIIICCCCCCLLHVKLCSYNDFFLFLVTSLCLYTIRFQVRSVGLDLTKNLFSIPVLKQFIDLLAMYKLNHLILNLADDHAWRLEMEKIDFDELHTVSSSHPIPSFHQETSHQCSSQ